MIERFRQRCCGFIVAVIIAATCQSAASASTHRTPLVMQGRWAVVTVRLGPDRRPYKFIVDTAAGATVIDRSLAGDFAKMRAGATSAVQGASGMQADFQKATLGRLQIAGLAFRSLDVVVTDMSRFGAKDGQHYDGILGNDVLSRFAYVFDVPSGQLTLVDSDLPDPHAWGQCLANPLNTRSGGNNRFLAVPVRLRSGSDAVGIVDTGAASSVLKWPAATAMGLSTTSPGVVTAPRVSGFDPKAGTDASRATINGMTMQKTSLPDVSAKLSDLPVFEGFGLRSEAGAILGADVCRTVPFAAARGNMALCRPS